MINVQIQPFAKNLMTAYIGALAYQQNLLKNASQQALRSRALVEKAKIESDTWTEMSFDLTTSMIDKRYTDSKLFIASGGGEGKIRFKKTLTEQQKRLQYITEQNMLKARTKYENTISTYNQNLNNKKMRASTRGLDLRQFV